MLIRGFYKIAANIVEFYNDERYWKVLKWENKIEVGFHLEDERMKNIE